MERWVLLLRGVNVGGVVVRSADLREVLEGLGLQRVRTVLATGNAVVDAPAGEGGAALVERVEAALEQRYGRRVAVVAVPCEALGRVVAAYPFARADDRAHPYVVFSRDPAALSAVAARAAECASHDVERVEAAGDVLYWECPRGSSLTTPVSTVLDAARYREALTTRNLRTLEKVLAVT